MDRIEKVAKGDAQACRDGRSTDLYIAEVLTHS
jgi:hypothetical protein